MRGVCLGVLMVGLALAGSAQAGVGVAKFAVESSPGKADQPVAHKTPAGFECTRGIVAVKALAGERFEYAGKNYNLKELVKALEAANRPVAFDCVVIDGSASPSPKKLTDVIAKLGKGSVKHVEWSGPKAAKPGQPGSPKFEKK